MKGRRPIPSHLKLVRGNPGKRPVNSGEAQPPLSRPMPPEHLTDDAKVEWGRLIDRLYDCGLMTDIDRAAFAAYCDSYAQWCEASRAMAAAAKADPDSRGLTVKTTNGNLIQNPLIGMIRRARADMLRFAVEFGMTPSARSRIDIGIGGDGAGEREPQRAGAEYF